jgi:hypothetical protein
MKYVKMLGLAVIAASALMAFVGAGSASATTLCTNGVNASGLCETGATTRYPVGTKFLAESTHATLTVTGGATNEVTCKNSSTEVEQTSLGNDTGGAVTGKITDLTFTNCVTVGGISGLACTVTTGSGYTGEMKATDNKGNGTLTVTSTTSTKVVCGSIFSCTYTTAKGGVVLNVTGGAPATFATPAAGVTLTSTGGFGCGSASVWHATYTSKSPDAGKLWLGTGDA